MKVGDLVRIRDRHAVGGYWDCLCIVVKTRIWFEHPVADIFFMSGHRYGWQLPFKHTDLELVSEAKYNKRVEK